ncbi:hypothetical protein ACIA8K_12510 [Catenuloplanes sp. NPDC051500]|uniref:hypothetical protein n=1 Tax=Catenuloplanes sp. NPDC051500 TaxID=3363959 RepID=UPI0037B7624F
MTARDDMKIDSPLFRAVITRTWRANPDAPEWSGRHKSGSVTYVYGPYVTPGPAKAWITREKNEAARRDDGLSTVTGVIETCQPAWAPLES